MEIPASKQNHNQEFLCKQNHNQEFLSRKRGICMQKSKSELWDLCQLCYIITENKCVKFQSTPFSTYGDTSLHAKNLTTRTPTNG
jgi:hypothetical protein